MGTRTTCFEACRRGEIVVRSRASRSTDRLPQRAILLGIGLALCAASPARGQGGYDPSLMLSWACSVNASQRGPIDIADPDPERELASHGTPGDALGPPTANSAEVFSLGDGGSITLSFAPPECEEGVGIGDGPGDDFASYENGFFNLEGLFAEFAFVEVSTNGTEFARFDATSLRTTTVDSFESVDPTDYDNFAGDQPHGLGTGFDLAELAGHPLVTSGALDLDDVRYVRLVDVIGNGWAFDANGQPVYDPHPTAFPSGGFDVDAVGVLHAPEPGANEMLATGMMCLALLAKRRRCRSRGSSRQPVRP